VHRQYERVKALLGAKQDKLSQLAEALVERETLDADEIRMVMEGVVLPPAHRVVIPTYAEKDKAAKDKRKVASIFGGPPKPATSG
jgi:cell division protease FtsH